MSDRLAELRRQRALVQEHLAWLEREIAAAENDSRSAPSSLTSSPVSAPATPPPIPAPEAAAAGGITPQAEAILEEYRVAPDTLQRDVRKGCLLYFAAGLLLFAATLVGLFYALRSR